MWIAALLVGLIILFTLPPLIVPYLLIVLVVWGMDQVSRTGGKVVDGAFKAVDEVGKLAKDLDTISKRK